MHLLTNFGEKIQIQIDFVSKRIHIKGERRARSTEEGERRGKERVERELYFAFILHCIMYLSCINYIPNTINLVLHFSCINCTPNKIIVFCIYFSSYSLGIISKITPRELKNSPHNLNSTSVVNVEGVSLTISVCVYI